MWDVAQPVPLPELPDGLVEEAYGATAAVELVSRLDAGGANATIERIFARRAREVEPDWRDYLRSL